MVPTDSIDDKSGHENYARKYPISRFLGSRSSLFIRRLLKFLSFRKEKRKKQFPVIRHRLYKNAYLDGGRSRRKNGISFNETHFLFKTMSRHKYRRGKNARRSTELISESTYGMRVSRSPRNARY